ncbi:hypothetical protein DFH09DRAFT_1484505 [Mycena vulgaris]|nr:hypothetical protein DFH09DRAFT_1484505 [Mycena vulgaris]
MSDRPRPGNSDSDVAATTNNLSPKAHLGIRSTPDLKTHLFNHVIIGSPRHSSSYDQANGLSLTRQRCSRLFKVLNASPRLIWWIKSIKIYLDTVPPDVLNTISTFPFVRLRRIAVAGNWATRSVIDEIQEFLSLETLTKVSISGRFHSISDFTQVLKCCSPNIKDVSFRSVRLAASNANLLPHSDRRIEIDGLGLWWSHEIHDWLKSPQCPFDFANVRHLRLNENTSQTQWAAFAASVPHVEHLKFQPRMTGRSIIDLAPFTKLKSIGVFAEYKSDLSSALDVLSTTARPDRIYTLRLRLPHTNIPDADLGMAIDRRIVTLLPHLAAVELVYGSEPPRRVAQNLPILSARKLVRVCVDG